MPSARLPWILRSFTVKRPCQLFFIILARKVSRRRAGLQRFLDLFRIGEVLLAHWRGGDVHHVAPALLIFHRRDGVDHVAVPPHGIARLQRRNAGQCFDKQRVPLLGNRQHAPRRHAAEFVFRHVVQQRTQQNVGHCFRDRHHVQQPLAGDHVRQRRPALEGAEHRAFGGVIHGVFFHFSTVRGVPRIVFLDVAVKHAGKHLLVGRQQPALQRAGIGVRAQPF